MKKIYLLTAFVFGAVISKAQSCDTVNMPMPSNWSTQSYISQSLFGSLGYISGVNSDNFTIQANFFDLSSTSFAYLQGVMVRFTKANTNQDTSLAKPIYFRLYADNNGTPGAEITNDQTKGMALFSRIKNDVALGGITGINFPSPVALPANKKFYVGVDLSNFEWYSPESHYDSICIASTGDNETVNTAWNFDADVQKWKSYPRVWATPPNDLEPLDVTLDIFPYVSTSAVACAVLPVKLVSFTAEKNAENVFVKWQVATESNMKGYEVERADNNNIFRSMGFVPAHNDLKAEHYSFTDKNAFVNSSTVQYRLKQIDGDGSIEYSKITSLSSNNVSVAFGNPFSGILNLHLHITSPQTIAISLFDVQGKAVLVQKPVLYNASSNIRLNGTSGLQAGTYILKVTIGNEQYAYKILKQ